METEKKRKLELFNRPHLEFLDAYTGPDILHPTHQVFRASIKLKRTTLEELFSYSKEMFTLSFCDKFGTDIALRIIHLDYQDTPNHNIVSVTVTGLFPLKDIYRVDYATNPEEDVMGY